ncbi:MAG: hypothetical protein R3C28_26215 [Pirellulaceae bacterium]
MIKAILAGADVGMVVSAIYRHGVDVIRSLLDGLIAYMEHHHFASLGELESARLTCPELDRRREDYIHALAQKVPGGQTRTDQDPHGDRWGHPNNHPK